MSVAFKARILVAEDEEFIFNLLRTRMDYNLEVRKLTERCCPPQWLAHEVKAMTLMSIAHLTASVSDNISYQRSL